MNQTQHTPALALGIDEAARAIGVARSMLYEIVAGGGTQESVSLFEILSEASDQKTAEPRPDNQKVTQ